VGSVVTWGACNRPDQVSKLCELPGCAPPCNLCRPPAELGRTEHEQRVPGAVALDGTDKSTLVRDPPEPWSVWCPASLLSWLRRRWQHRQSPKLPPLACLARTARASFHPAIPTSQHWARPPISPSPRQPQRVGCSRSRRRPPSHTGRAYWAACRPNLPPLPSPDRRARRQTMRKGFVLPSARRFLMRRA
jgi:hypothetical protein